MAVGIVKARLGLPMNTLIGMDRPTSPTREPRRMGATRMTMPALGKHIERWRAECAALAAFGLLMPVIAGLAGWLAATPASAQPKQPEAGAAAAAPPESVDLANRKQLLIVGSTSMKGITDAVVEHL